MFRKFTSERVRRARRQRIVILSVIYGLLVLSIFLVLWQLSYTPFLRVDHISVVGTKVIPRQDIFDSVVPHLSGAYIGIFSKRNKLLLSRFLIEEELIRDFPRIQNVAISVRDNHTLFIELTEHEPEALVCRARTDSECYFVNADGYIFAEAPHFYGESYVAYSASLVEEPVGKRFLSSSGSFKELHTFVRSLEKLSLFPQGVSVSESALTVTARAQADTVQLLFNRSMPFEESFRNLEAILHEKDFSIQSVESIDLRFGNKVFFREEGSGVPPQESAL